MKTNINQTERPKIIRKSNFNLDSMDGLEYHPQIEPLKIVVGIIGLSLSIMNSILSIYIFWEEKYK